MLDHEGLDVYQLALDFLVVASGIIEGLPRGRSHLADPFHARVVLPPSHGAHSSAHGQHFPSAPSCTGTRTFTFTGGPIRGQALIMHNEGRGWLEAWQPAHAVPALGHFRLREFVEPFAVDRRDVHAAAAFSVTPLVVPVRGM
jgi:hypothetical protein